MTREEFATYLSELRAERDGNESGSRPANCCQDHAAALADDCLKEVYDYVQWCRENGETDLRGTLHTIKMLRNQLQKIESQPK